MNLYSALNFGDASIKEPHLTSLIYYLFKSTHIEMEPQKSFLSFFLQNNFNIDIKNFPNFDIEKDIQIEEILKFKGKRRDCDLTIYLNNGEIKTIVNIENKINFLAYQETQIDEQNELLNSIHSDYNIINSIILPYPKEEIERDTSKKIYWHLHDQSIINQFDQYLNSIKPTLDNIYNKLTPFKSFLCAFGDNIEQIRLSETPNERGPKNKLGKTMYEYLKEISENWDELFKYESVKVSDLIRVFEKNVTNDINDKNPKDKASEMIAKFKRGALEAQPKIMTINEKNRVHFGITSPETLKNLFYYPQYPDGEYSERWKDLIIKPLSKFNENKEYDIFYREKGSDTIGRGGYSI